MTEFRILGPVEVIAAGEPLDLGTAKQRAVLAALLVETPSAVSPETLVDRVWNEDPPPEARRSLLAHLSRIRSVLAKVTLRSGVPVQLLRTVGSYRLQVAPDRIDLHRARSLVEQARSGAVDLHGCAVRLREAADCWRGEPLAGVAGDWFSRVRDDLVRQHLDVRAEWAEAELRLGHPVKVIDGLRAVVTDHPAAEQVVEQLMRALAAAGRNSEALELYANTRAWLAEQLGASPATGLQAVHRAILRGRLTPPVGAAPATVRAGAAPVAAYRQLPPDIAEFTGRSPEVATLLADDAAPARTAPAIVAIVGMGGVGKTRLALHAAHRLVASGRFEEGQLYVDLRGFAGDGGPADPGEALGELLRLLGVPPDGIPDSVAARSAVLRDRLADRRVLVLLDNAADESQVEPLLPGSPAGMVLITSRRNLALDGARVVKLDVFSATEAVDLLAAVVGPARVAAEPAAARQLVERCGLLPLAVAIAGHRLRARPTWGIEHLAARLGDDGDALDELAVGSREIRAVLGRSYEALTATQQRTFRLLGLHPGADFTAGSAAALTGADPAEAENILEFLLDQHLLHQRTVGRYHMHDLIRAFAKRTGHAADAEKERDEAVPQLLDWYLHAAEAAAQLVRRFDPPVVAHFDAPRAPLPELTDLDGALGWLDAEATNLIAVARTAATGPWHGHAMQLPHVLQPYFIKRSRIDQWLIVAQLGAAAADASDNPSARAHACTDVANARGSAGQTDLAVAGLRRAIPEHRALGDEHGEALARNHLGTYLRRIGEHTGAAEHFAEALRLFRRCGDPVREVSTQSNLSVQLHILGRDDEAIEQGHAALALQQELGGGPDEASTRTNLGWMYARLGRHDEAIEHTRIALAHHRATASGPGASRALANLGYSYAWLGRPQEALDASQEALEISRRLGDRSVETSVLNTLGDVHRLAGRATQACDMYRRAAHLAAEAGDVDEAARAHAGLASTS